MRSHFSHCSAFVCAVWGLASPQVLRHVRFFVALVTRECLVIHFRFVTPRTREYSVISLWRPGAGAESFPTDKHRVRVKPHPSVASVAREIKQYTTRECSLSCLSFVWCSGHSRECSVIYLWYTPGIAASILWFKLLVLQVIASIVL